MAAQEQSGSAKDRISPIVSPRWERIAAAAIIAAFGLLALAYSLGNPIFEAQDEVSHYRMIRFVLNTRGLPGKVWDPASSDESGQAPLYYIVGAIIRSPFPDSDFEQNYFQRSDKNLNWGYEKRVVNNDNKNIRFHTAIENFPYNLSETALVVHILRLYSVLIAIGTVTAAYFIFRLLWPDRPDRRLVALGFVAFWPHFIYVSASITNDNLIYLTGTLSLLVLLRLLRNGPTWRSAIVMGLALGLAALSKANGMFLALPMGVAVIADRRLWKYVPAILGAMLVVCAWWYIRNLILFGGLSGFEAFWAHQPSFHVKPGQQTLDQWVGRMTITYEYVWARFGLAEIPVSDVIYRFYDVMMIGGLAGFGVWAWRHVRRPERQTVSRGQVVVVAVMITYTLAWVAALGYVATQEWFGVHARHYYPGVAGWGALIAVGWDVWIPARFRLRAALTQAAVFAAIAVICLFGFIMPAYRALPAPKTIEHPLSYTYGDAAELIGIDQPDIHVRPGDRMYITLYWRAIKPTDRSLMAYLHTVHSAVVKRDSYPATGTLLSTEWQPGQTWAERFYVVIPDDTEVQQTYPLIAGLQDPSKKKEPLPVTGPEGSVDLPVIGRVTVDGPSKPFDPEYKFGGVIGLGKPTISRAGDNLSVCLDWMSLAATPTDYQVFIHVKAPPNPVAAQRDRPPSEGFPTSAWLPGQSVHNCSNVDVTGVPDTGWSVLIGLYDLASGERLPVIDRSGQNLPDATVEVRP